MQDCKFEELKTAINEWKAKKKSKTTWLADPRQDRPNRLSSESIEQTGIKTNFEKNNVSKSSKQCAVTGALSNASTERSNVIAKSYDRYNLIYNPKSGILFNTSLKKSMGLEYLEIYFLLDSPFYQEKVSPWI